MCRSMEKQTQRATPAPLFTTGALFALIWPMLLEQFLGITMGMADTFMVSGVGEAAVSGVSLVDTINVLVTQLFAALTGGGAIITSQYLGRRDRDNAVHSAAQLYTVSMFATIALMVLVLVLHRPILRLVFGAIDADVMQLCETYFVITALSYPFIGLYNAGTALFRVQGNSRISMFASLVMNCINIAGNAVLIYGLKLGVTGAAAATLAGRIFAALWVYTRQQHSDNPLRIDDFSLLRPQKSFIRGILGLGLPSGLENSMFQIGKICVSSLVSTLGTASIAANAVANTVSSLSTLPGTTISIAMTPVVGRCLGAGDKKQARGYARLLMGVACGGLVVFNLVLYAVIPEITALFSLSAQATADCIQVVRVFNIVSIFFWGTSFTLPNALRSGGDARFTMTVSIISMWVFRVVCSYVLVLGLHMGLMGVWAGMFIDWGCRSVCFVARFRGGRWMDHKVI